MAKKIWLKDVANKAGVSVGTASRVINKVSGVKEENRKRVLNAIEEMGYHIDDIARSMRARNTNTIGVLIPDIANEFYSDVVRGMEDIARMHGYSYILSSTDSITEKELHAVKMMKEKRVDGIMIMSHTVSDALLTCLKDNNITAVFVASGTMEAPFYSVAIDNKKAAFDAVQAFIKNGLTKIAMISGPSIDPSGGVARLEGYKSVLQAYGIAANENYIQIGTDYSYQNGYELMKNLLILKDRPQAVFAAGDYMAIGAMKAISEQKLYIPEDIQVIGFDNLLVSQYCTPSLTTVNQPRYEMGRVAMELLLDGIVTTSNKEHSVLFEHCIVTRDSTR